MRDTMVGHAERPASAIAPSTSDSGARGGVRIALLGVLLTVCGCGVPANDDASHKINGAVHVEAGKAAGSAETVNGSIHIDANAVVTRATTVNGSIHVGAHATAETLKTVNGTISLDEGVRVAGGVESVNGALTLHDGADVTGAIKNVAGRIELHSAHVAGGIRTVGGDISILGESHVEGGIVVQKPGGVTFVSDPPRIVIGPGTSVQGELRFEREVRLYVSDKANVGPVTGATAVAYSGDSPPG